MSRINRPNVRCREEAKRARENQAKPLVEQDSSQVVEWDNVFNRVTVPNSQLDDMSKNVMAILGPYRNVLGGPPLNGLHAAKASEQPASGCVTDNEKISVAGYNRNSSGANVLRSLSTSSKIQKQESGLKDVVSNASPSYGVDSKQSSTPSSLKKSRSSSPSSPYSTSKPGNSSSDGFSYMPSSSSYSSVPQYEPGLLTSRQTDEAAATKEKSKGPVSSCDNGRVKTAIATLETVPSIPKQPSSMRSMKVDHHQPNNVVHSSKHSSKSITHDRRSPSSASSRNSQRNTGPSKNTIPTSLAANKDKQSSNIHDSKSIHSPPSQPSKTANTSTPVLYRSPVAMCLPDIVHTVTPRKMNAGVSNGARTPIVKLDQPGIPSPPSHSSASNLRPSSASGAVTTGGVNSTEKMQKLTVVIPSQIKQPTSKSDLNDILKELTEVHAPLTAIHTPQKAENGFHFSTADGHELSPLLENPQDLHRQNFVEKSGQAPEKSIRVTSDLPSKAAENQQKTKSIYPSEISTEAAAEGENAGGRCTSMGVVVSGPTGVQDRTSRCNSSSSRRGSDDSRESGPESVGKTMRDVNSMLRHDLDLSEDDSDAEPTFVENTSASQSKKGKVMSPSLGTIISAVSPMSSDSGSSESSSDSSEDDDDDEGGAESRKENSEEKKQKPKGFSERRLSSSGSDTSSSSSSESDSDNDEDDDDDEAEENKGNKVSENKGTAQASEVMASKESCEKTPSPTDMNGLDGPAHSTVSQNRSWGLVQFLPTPKKSSSSPASVSPLKPGSPSISHSAPASVQPSQSAPPSVQPADSAPATVQQKDGAAVKAPDESQTQIQQEMERCDSMPFDLHVFSEQDTSCRQVNGDGILGSELNVCRIRNKYSTSSEKSCGSSLSEKSPTSGNTKPVKLKKSMSSSSSKTIDKVPSKKSSSGESSVSVHSNSSHVFRKEVRSSSFSYGSSSKDCGKTDPLTRSNGSQEKVSVNKAKNRLSSSSSQSSTDRNDTASLVPVVKSQSLPGKSVNEKSRQDLTNKKPTEKSSKHLEHSSSQGRDVPYHELKHHKRKVEADAHSSSLVSSSSSSTKSASANPVSSAEKASKKLFSEGIVTENQKEAASKPTSLIVSSPQSARTSPRESSLKPLPTSQSSFTTPSFSVTTDLPSYVRVIQTPDGIKKHQIMVQIQRSFLSKKVISMLKEKRERRRRFSRDVKLDKSSSKSEGYSDVSKESPVPVLLESSKAKSSSMKGTDAQGSYQTQKSLSSVSSSSAQAASTQPPRIHRQKSNDHDNNNRVTSNGTSSSPEPGAANTKHSSSEASSQRLEKSSSHSSSKSSRTTTTAAAQPTTSAQNNKASSTSIAKHQSLTNGNKSENSSKPDNKQKTEKRKLDMDKEAFLKKTKLDQTSETAEESNPTIINNRRDSSSRSSSKGSQKSSSLKKSNHIPSPSSHHTSPPAAVCKDKEVVPAGNSKIVDQVAITNGTESATPQVNRQQNSGVKDAPSSSSALTDLPAPYPVETHLHSTKHYLARAKEHKHHADGLRDRVGKYEPYLRSGLSFFLAGYTMELSKKELTTSCTMYNDTFNLLQYVVRTQANSSSNVESSDHERKMIALIIRLQAYLNYRQYQLKMAEVGKLRKSIESEQAKLLSSTSAAAATTPYSSSSIATAARTHAPSPHQTSWNKSSTGTPSPMSPTPSPASSFSSQGSCEFVNGRIPNGNSNSTSMTSPSLASVSSIQQRLNSATLKYFNLTKPLVKALELWDLADAESKAFGDFFAALDSACGPLSFHSAPLVIVRYLKHALRVNSLMQLKSQ